MAETCVYNVKLKYKLPFEERTRYRANENRVARFIEHMSEEVPEGEEAKWAIETTPEVAEDFAGAENIEYIEEAVVDEAFGPIENGVDRDQRVMNRTRGLKKGPLTPLMMVPDTGATENAYVKSRELARWTWFSDDARDRNSHGSWCLGAATAPEPGRFVISAKTLGDNGSGLNSYTIAALYQFARLCRDRGVPGVASASLGSNTPSNAYRDAIAFCASVNVAVIAAAGNQSRRDGVSSPAMYCTSVGAHDRNYAAASFSNRNATHTLPDGYALGVSVNGIGGTKTGSSMGCPGVAFAVWYAMSRGMSAGVVRTALRSHNAGGGRVLDGGRLMALAGKDEPAPTPEPKPDTKPDTGTMYRIFAAKRQRGAFRQLPGALETLGEMVDEHGEATITKS